MGQPLNHLLQNDLAKVSGREIDNKLFKSESVNIFQKRFMRYKESLFTFIAHDGIDWNNNMAERNIQPIAIQRKISMAFREKGAERYLLLLGIAQTCKLQGKSFLKFLLSKDRDVDTYKPVKGIIYSKKRERNSDANVINF
jgi:hypothetical protein